MKQILQSYKTGELGFLDVPVPVCDQNGVLIRTTASLVSAGTEKMIVDIARKSLLGKAWARPDLVKQVVNKMRREGVKSTLEKVFTKLDTPIPLGYSCTGKVLEVGAKVAEIAVGDRVACGGAGYANHSEINYVPKNLCARIPKNVDDIDAAFVTAGAIALQGVRQAQPAIGENVAVIGLGLIGQLTVQLLKANSCRVLGCDIDPDKNLLARTSGANAVCKPGELIEAAQEFSNGNGVDCTIITASTSSNQPVNDAGEITKLKGKVVVVGMVGMDIPRNVYYRKELDIRLSMSYGPGRYDPQYEEKSIDYPFSYVRWTEQRNFEAFLVLVSEGKVNPKSLVTHEFDFNDALKAYDLIGGKKEEKYLGIILKYSSTDSTDYADFKDHNRTIALKQVQQPRASNQQPAYGLIGAGNFTKSVILPSLAKVGGFKPIALCTATGISAHAVGTKHGFAEITTDSETIFTNDRINTVFIATRHDTHADYVVRALQAGKHVFVEKPLCLNKEELEEITTAFNSKSQITQPTTPILMVGFNRRFSPLIRKMKEIAGDNPMALTYRINAGTIPRDHWIQDQDIGGGRIVGEVCHFVDTCSFLTGSEPISVFASCVRKKDKSIPDEDNVSIIITYANGSTAAIHYFAYGNRNVPKEYIELFFGNTAIQMTNFRELKFFSGSKKQRIKKMSQDKGFKAEFTAFKKAVETGTPSVPFESLVNTSRVTFAAIESLRTGERSEVRGEGTGSRGRISAKERKAD